MTTAYLNLVKPTFSEVRNSFTRTDKMKIEEAILYVRKDGKPVTSEQVYAVVMHHPDTFVKAEGRIMLMI